MWCGLIMVYTWTLLLLLCATQFAVAVTNQYKLGRCYIMLKLGCNRSVQSWCSQWGLSEPHLCNIVHIQYNDTHSPQNRSNVFAVSGVTPYGSSLLWTCCHVEPSADSTDGHLCKNWDKALRCISPASPHNRQNQHHYRVDHWTPHILKYTMSFTNLNPFYQKKLTKFIRI